MEWSTVQCRVLETLLSDPGKLIKNSGKFVNFQFTNPYVLKQEATEDSLKAEKRKLQREVSDILLIYHATSFKVAVRTLHRARKRQKCVQVLTPEYPCPLFLCSSVKRRTK